MIWKGKEKFNMQQLLLLSESYVGWSKIDLKIKNCDQKAKNKM